MIVVNTEINQVWHSFIQFCLENEISASKTLRMLQKPIGKHVISQEMMTNNLKKAEKVLKTKIALDDNQQSTRQVNQRFSAQKSSIDN